MVQGPAVEFLLVLLCGLGIWRRRKEAHGVALESEEGGGGVKDAVDGRGVGGPAARGKLVPEEVVEALGEEEVVRVCGFLNHG